MKVVFLHLCKCLAIHTLLVTPIAGFIASLVVKKHTSMISSREKEQRQRVGVLKRMHKHNTYE